MITFVNGNIFDSPLEALVNPVNCVGVMGAGLAKQFRRKYPSYFLDYKQKCMRNAIRLGEVDIYGPVIYRSQYLISFPTKNHFTDKSQLQWISRGLTSLMAKCREKGITSVAIPAVGCGLGELDWEVVKEMLNGVAISYPKIKIQAFAPHTELTQAILGYEDNTTL